MTGSCGWKEGVSLKPSEGEWLCQHRHFRVLASRTAVEYTCIVLSQQVSGNCQQP